MALRTEDSVRFYFARIRFEEPSSNESDRGQPIREDLVRYIRSTRPVYEDDDSEWRFGRCIVEDDYAVGTFGRVYESSLEMYDSENEDFTQLNDTNIAESSFFIIFFDLNIIAFNRRQRIGYRQFTNRFAEGFNQRIRPARQLSVELIERKENIDRILMEMPDVQVLDFDLRPTNPEADDEMENLDERIKNMRANRFGLRADAGSAESLNTDDELLRAAIQFVRREYGEAVAVRKTEEGEYTRDTRKRPATEEVEQPEEIDDLEKRRTDLIEYAQTLIERGEIEDPRQESE